MCFITDKYRTLILKLFSASILLLKSVYYEYRYVEHTRYLKHNSCVITKMIHLWPENHNQENDYFSAASKLLHLQLLSLEHLNLNVR